MRFAAAIGLASLFLSASANAEFAAQNIELMAQVRPPSSGSTYDIWGWTDDQSGTEYALLGNEFGVYIYDLTDPYNPELATHWLTRGFDVKVYGDHAYTTNRILDLSILRTPNVPSTVVSSGQFSPNFHNVFVNETTGRLYGSSPGLRVYDLADPLAPNFLYDTMSGGSHDAMSTIYHGPDERYQGREILFGSQYGSFKIHDVTEPTHSQRLATRSYSGANIVHQGWPSRDHNYFYLNDEGNFSFPGTKTHIFDISDLEQPVYVGFYAGETHATAHNLFTKGELLYMANYSGGVRIARIDDPGQLDLTEIAFLDTYPAHDFSGFVGAFSIYPFFESGTLIASDMSSGLFVMRLDLGNDADLNNDSLIDCGDVDALVEQIANDTQDVQFDLTNDGLVTHSDLREWQRQAGEALIGPGATILTGDANLDGTVDGQDFLAWNNHRFTANASWCSGDFNADGLVGGRDFLLWNDHKFQTSDNIAAIPEPNLAWWLAITVGRLLSLACRKRADKNCC